PPSDGYFTYELLGGVPDHLDANQAVRFAYRVTCKQSLRGPNQPGGGLAGTPASGRAPRRQDLGSGCLTYSGPVQCTYVGICANGLPYAGSAGSGYYYGYSPASCGGQPTGGGAVFGGGSTSGGGVGYTPAGTPLPGPQCFPGQPCPQTGQC